MTILSWAALGVGALGLAFGLIQWDQMCIRDSIEGITPEAPTFEAAVGNKKIKEVITITEQDLADTRQRLCREPKKIDFAMFGCPHITINQVATIARVCEGKKFKVPVWLLVSSLTKELAERMGYNACLLYTSCRS